MHRALQVPELVQAICSQVLLETRDDYWPIGESGRQSRCDLAALARTCKNFQEPALDRLWSHQTTFAHILSCMPRDLWNGPVLPAHGSETPLDFIRPIVSSDWERPLFYMSRVQSFNSRYPLSKDLFETLALSLPTEHLFPNLRDLRWIYDHNDLFPCIRLLLAPRIVKLRIRLSTTVSHLSFLPTLAFRCPDLLDVTVSSDIVRADFRPHLQTSTSLFVCGLKRIERLCVNSFDDSAFQYLGALPSLKFLEVIHLDTSPSLPAADLHARLFSSLQSLKILTKTFHPAIAVTKALAASQLDSIDITIETAEGFSTFCDVLTQYVPHASLRYLKIHSDSTYPYETHNPRIERDTIKRLSCFPNLKSVFLDFSGGFNLDDGVISQLARAWPNLEFLTFLHHELPRVAPRVTLAGLRDLARHCPRICRLQIEVDALVVPPIQTHAGTPVQTSLVRWDAGWSTISNAPAVADFLYDIFPRLPTVHLSVSATIEGDVRTTELWREVGFALAARRAL
ncbi:hypothetical protein B0H11DRAFT_2105828 [Mycena galericulata]|nr:hypothetical protein B0H11DRAFT_2105828 [Mycena galericulata]